MRLWVSHVGHQTFKINEDLGQFLTETTFELQISHIQCYYGYLKVLILIFLIALRLFQSSDYPFKTTTTTATESDWLSFQPKNLSWIYWMGCVLWRGWGGGLHTSSKLFRGWVKSGRCKSGSWHKRKNLQILNLQIFAALLIHLLTTTTDFDKLFLKFFLCSHSWCL